MPEEAAQRILDLLDRAIPPPRRGTRVLDRALARAGLDDLPHTTEELKAFVRTSLRATLEDELGMQVANEVANDLDAALSPALRRCETWPASPSSRRLKRMTTTTVRGDGVVVLVVGSDRLRNASVARSLAGHGFRVATAQDVAEVVVAGAENPEAIVVDERCALDPPEALRSLVARARWVAVYGCGNPPLAEREVRALGCARVAALSTGSSSRELLSTLSTLLAS